MTVRFTATSLGSKFALDADAVRRCVDTLRDGGLVVHPTDTVYGLGTDPFQDAAVARLYAVKKRPRDLAVSVCVADVEEVFRLGETNALADAFCAKNLPGPFTVVLRATSSAPEAILSKDRRIGLRVPAHPIPRLFAKRFGPITSTSANLHGRPAPCTCDDAFAQLGGSVDVYVDGGPATLGRESTVVDLTGPRAKVLRDGAVPKEP